MRRGHGPAVYGYGLSWFMRCLRAAEAADATARKDKLLERAGRAVDMRLAAHGKAETFKDHVNDLLREVG
ncbi:hypothetical protein DesfrDRAFT_0156 [Solidesulfovibrio fructosivorans JJ]]|uniref:Uncharacterized protein n=1 Tax=Solidesulfovibrio fructosivorans JJ] TaxID=596151 RepID=E1JRA7_SOLFR|nr:hypothetical protein DesfrDRAFT_0156 [Solidesulfovibrio fructosivorans JJ]]